LPLFSTPKHYRMSEEYMDLAVAGLHLSGQPLNHQLLSMGAVLKKTTCTSSRYHMYLIEDKKGLKPGLIRVPYEQEGFRFDVEVWQIPKSTIGNFLSEIPAPLGLGKVVLEDGSIVTGFICEPCVLMEGKDISSFSGWKAYIQYMENSEK
jgi:allophanate hydrolase